MNEDLNVLLLKDDDVKYQVEDFGMTGYSRKFHVYCVKENGIIKKKYLSIYARVDLGYISSKEYKQK